MAETETHVVKALVGWAEMCQAFDTAVEHLLALLRELPVEAGDRPVPGLEWTVAETAAHLIGILGRGLDDWRRGETLDELHVLNAVCIEEVDTRDLHDIADRIEAVWRRGMPLRAAVRGDEPFPLHAGVVAEVSAAISYGVWDFFVHGFDIATATGATWQIPPDEAARTLRAGLPALRPWVNPIALAGTPQRLAIAFFPEEPALALKVGGGRYEVELASAQDADGIADPAHVLLAISGRQPSEDRLVGRLASWFVPL